MSLLIRLLLLAYPADFREEFGDELRLLFRDTWRDAGVLARAHRVS